MSSFTDTERTYLESQRIGRIATVSGNGEVHVAPVGFRYNADLDRIEIGGMRLVSSRKFKNVQEHPVVAFVVDDVHEKLPRGIEIRGEGEAIGSGVEPPLSSRQQAAVIRIRPTAIVSWGISSGPYEVVKRKIGDKDAHYVSKPTEGTEHSE